MTLSIKRLLLGFSAHCQAFFEKEQRITFCEGISFKGVLSLRPEHLKGKKDVLAKVCIEIVQQKNLDIPKPYLPTQAALWLPSALQAALAALRPWLSPPPAPLGAPFAASQACLPKPPSGPKLSQLALQLFGLCLRGCCFGREHFSFRVSLAKLVL